MNENQIKCAEAGMALARDMIALQKSGDEGPTSPTIFQANIQNGLKEEDFNIPSTELTDFFEAAGKKLIAFFLTETSTYAIYDDNGSCSLIYGTDEEILSGPVLRVAREIYK